VCPDSPLTGMQVQTACHRTIIPSGDQPQSVFFLTEILPEPELPRAPLNLALVLDRTGPVLKECLPGLKQALRDLVGQMTPQDTLSLASIGGEVIIPAQPVQDIQWIGRLIDRFMPAEEARSSAGIQEGLKQIQAGMGNGRINRLILVLGGEASQPVETFRPLADQAFTMNTPLIAIGVGSTWDENLLFELADRSIGAPPGSMTGLTQHIPTPDDIFMIAREVFTALFAVGRQLKVRMLLSRRITVNHVWQVRPQIKKLDHLIMHEAPVVIPAGDLPQQGLAFLVEASFPPRAPGPVRVAQIEVSVQTQAGGLQSYCSDLIVYFASDSGGTNPLDAYVMDFVESAQAHEMCLQAIADLQVQHRQEAANKLRQAAAILISQGQAGLADRIRGEADYNIRQYGQVSKEGRKLILLASQRGRSEEN
jgi:Ca-activated chloride channel homolog